VDDFQVPLADQLIDRRSSDAECLPGVFDGEQEDELTGVAGLTTSDVAGVADGSSFGQACR
jgi:hypothetical protein